MVDDISLQSMTRKYMESIIKTEKIDNAYWVAAIHYDTDNIHVHTSLVQTEPDRIKGKFRQHSLKIAKSAAVHALDRSHQKHTIAINDLLRNKMIEKHIGREIATTPELMLQYNDILHQLPKDTRLWKYNMNALAAVRPEINKFIDAYLLKHKPSELQEYNRLINKIEAHSQYLYGNTAISYADNKRQEMYSRMGNALLKDMIEHVKEIDSTPLASSNERDKKVYTPQTASFGRATISQYRRLHYYLNDEWEHIKNEIVYDQLQSAIEHGV